MAQQQGKLYVLAQDEMASNSPYTIEGTDTVLDIPANRNLPWHYTIITDDGGERQIRWVRGAGSIFVDEQLKLGYTLDRKPTIEELKDLQIFNGQLYADRKKLMEYIDLLPLNENAPNRPQNVRNYIRESKPEEDKRQEYDIAVAKAKAQALVFTMPFIEAKKIVRVRYHNYDVSDETTVRLELSRMVSVEADGVEFINKHYMDSTNDTKLIVLATRAKEEELISMSRIPGSIALYRNKKWEQLVRISEAGGEASQFNRFVDWLKTQDGQPAVAILESLLPDEVGEDELSLDHDFGEEKLEDDLSK